MNLYLKVLCVIDDYFDAYDDPEPGRASRRGRMVIVLVWVANLISVVLLLSPIAFRRIVAHRNAFVLSAAIFLGVLSLPILKAMGRMKALVADDLDALEALRRYRLLAFAYVILSVVVCVGLFIAGRASD